MCILHSPLGWSYLKNHGSQIETVSKIVHTPITSLFKGAQLMNYAV